MPAAGLMSDREYVRVLRQIDRAALREHTELLNGIVVMLRQARERRER